MKKNIAQLDSSVIVRLVLTGNEYNELSWEDGSEFQWKGQMYDVISLSKTAAGISICCVADEKETALIDALMKADENAHHKGTVIMKMLSLDLFAGETAIVPVSENASEKDFNFHRVLFSSPFIPGPSQPPEYC